MWLMIRYRPTTLFSLRYSAATSTGAKSLLVPSPYTIKMALVVSAIRWQGVEFAQDIFEMIRDLRPVRIRPPEYAVVNRCFLKYQKPKEEKLSKKKRRDNYESPIGYQATVGFREYVYLQGLLEIALPIANEEQGHNLVALALRVNYFGKRGSLMQFVSYDSLEDLPDGFTEVIRASAIGGGILQPLDDMAPDLTFDKVDVTSDTQMRSSDRPTAPTVLPYRIGRTSVGYAAYVRAT